MAIGEYCFLFCSLKFVNFGKIFHTMLKPCIGSKKIENNFSIFERIKISHNATTTFQGRYFRTRHVSDQMTFSSAPCNRSVPSTLPTQLPATQILPRFSPNSRVKKKLHSKWPENHVNRIFFNFRIPIELIMHDFDVIWSQSASRLSCWYFCNESHRQNIATVWLIERWCTHKHRWQDAITNTHTHSHSRKQTRRLNEYC